MTDQKAVKDLTFNDLAKRAREEAEQFASHIIGEAPTYRSGREVRFYENQSLVVFISGGKQGKFKSFLDDEARGDLFDLWRYIRGGNNHDAVMGYKSYAGLDGSNGSATVKINAGPSKEELEKIEREEIEKRKKVAEWIWNTSSKTDGRDEGLAYLNGRGITEAPDSDTLRYRRLNKKDLLKMKVKETEIPETPVVALVFKATDDNGRISAVQQILTTEGKKVSFDQPKRTNGYLIGSSVKLGLHKGADTIATAEGPETALSVHQATGIPTLITLGTSNLMNINISKDVKTLIIASDMDANGIGLAAALKAAQFWGRNGVERAGIALPKIALGDFNDITQKMGDDAVSKSFDSAYFPERLRSDNVVIATPDSRVAFYAWHKAGLQTSVRLPPLNPKTGARTPINLESMIEDHHEFVFIVNKNEYEFDKTYVEENRENVAIVVCDDEAEEFLTNVHTPGYLQKLTQSADIYAPKGLGDKEAIAITLRRKDADALCDAGHQAIAIRASEVDSIDLSFVKDRRVILAPIGKGTAQDKIVLDRLNECGADATKLTWQIFHPSKDGLKIVRNDIPKGYGAAEAVAEGWKGKAMKDLLLISQLNNAQSFAQPIATPKKTKQEVL